MTVYSMYTVRRMTKISNSIVTENIINWLYFSIVIFFLHQVNIKNLLVNLAGVGIEPNV